MIPALQKTRFTEFLIQHNGMGEGQFEQWIFCAGMLFKAADKWWAGPQKRRTPHEGLDLCLYGDCCNKIFRLDENTKIPAMYDGTVVRIFNDFLGKSIIMEHRLPDSPRCRLLTICGHTNPRGDLDVGSNVVQGEVIATLADTGNAGSEIPHHLHITVGWSPKPISCDNLDWLLICDPDILTLLDPLQVVDGNYRIWNPGKSSLALTFKARQWFHHPRSPG